MTEPTIASERAAFLAYLSGERRLSANTVRAYAGDLGVLAARLAAPLAALTHRAVSAALQDSAASVATVQRRRAALSAFFRWAQREDLATHNPVDLTDAPQRTVALPRPVAAADVPVIQAAIAALPQPHKLVFTLLAETGMRAGEVLGLNIGDVELMSGREGLRVREPKNHHERIVVLTPDATPRSIRALRAWLRTERTRGPHAPLVCSNRGTRLSYAAIEKRWRQLCAAAGLVDGETPRYTIHQLRHTVATALIADGTRADLVGRQLGHRDPRSTQRYAAISEAQLRAALTGQRR